MSQREGGGEVLVDDFVVKKLKLKNNIHESLYDDFNAPDTKPIFIKLAS